MKQLILLIILALSLSAGAQTTYYIKEGGTGTKAGTTWENAGDNLQAVINKATSGDQIYVAAGTYTGGFVMREGVTVLGGFPSGANNATTLAERKLPGTGANLTILDGMNQTRVLTQEKDFNQETLWEGFVIQNGNATGVGTIIYGNINTTVPAGIVFAYDATTGIAKMIALEDASGTLEWGPRSDETRATDLVDGAKNWETIKAYIDGGKNWNNYPVWGYIKDLRETTKPGGYADWYLPALKELEEVYAQRHVLNAVLKGIDKSGLQNTRYWSGSEHFSDCAWYVDFSSGSVSCNDKNDQYHARAVRASTINYLTILQGGGAFLMQSGVLRNSVIKNCQASTGGGAYLSSKAQMEGCVVEHCVAKEASAVYVADEATLLSSTVVNNNVDRTPQYSVAPPKIGNFYYNDGTWGNVAANAIGIVCYINPHNPYSGYILHKEERYSNWQAGKSWAAGKGDGWQLSAIDVLRSIYSNKGELNTQINKIGGTDLSSTNCYWSGSEVYSDDAWYVDFSDGVVDSRSKYGKYRVRVVRAFQQF